MFTLNPKPEAEGFWLGKVPVNLTPTTRTLASNSRIEHYYGEGGLTQLVGFLSFSNNQAQKIQTF